MSIDYPANQGDVAWGNTLPQHKTEASLEGFFRAFYGPASDLTAALKALRENRGLETATGAQLDGIGTIVGVSRVIPQAIYLAYFGYKLQPAGRAYGAARYRRRSEAIASAFALNDDEYKSLIRAKIIKNNGHGTVEEIIAVALDLFKAVTVQVQRTATAALTITITRMPTDMDTILPYYEKFLPISGGINYTVSYVAA